VAAEDRIRRELQTGTLKALSMREGGEAFLELYLIFADRENAGPAILRLAEILRNRATNAGRGEPATDVTSVRRASY
jgi:hypothetical protein